jgi:predicted aconitase with swiveling domain
MSVARGTALQGRSLTVGRGRGVAVVLDEPLSLWGGMDPQTGRLIDRNHPQHGAELSGRVLVMPSGRGSSSSSTILAEAVRAGTTPAAIVLRDPDPILALGALVAVELYGRAIPVVTLGEAAYRAIWTGSDVEVEATDQTATVTLGPGRPDAPR